MQPPFSLIVRHPAALKTKNVFGSLGKKLDGKLASDPGRKAAGKRNEETGEPDDLAKAM